METSKNTVDSKYLIHTFIRESREAGGDALSYLTAFDKVAEEVKEWMQGRPASELPNDKKEAIHIFAFWVVSCTDVVEETRGGILKADIRKLSPNPFEIFDIENAIVTEDAKKLSESLSGELRALRDWTARKLAAICESPCFVTVIFGDKGFSLGKMVARDGGEAGLGAMEFFKTFIGACIAARGVVFITSEIYRFRIALEYGNETNEPWTDCEPSSYKVFNIDEATEFLFGLDTGLAPDTCKHCASPACRVCKEYEVFKQSLNGKDKC